MNNFVYNAEDYNCPQEQFDPQTFIDALVQFNKAMYNVYDLMDRYGLDCQDWLCENYPFEPSFDEQWHLVGEWIDSIREHFGLEEN